ncbi:uncharacterized protein LOC101848192 [Aplysia californica]|uniref:Uncharacterized protein LOC101848192 n=1 Tax=Aplysia californica TaxID=6500 RepID=A0ABM1VR36_APLCA|nr:uncharacterized protein LOC101848192 [Aplysia californica]
MVKPKAELSGFIEDMDPEQRERIYRITNMDFHTVSKERRKNWKKSDFIKHAFRMVRMMTLATSRSKRYFNPDDPDAGPATMRKQRQIYKKGKVQQVKASISFELQEVLETNPVYRTQDHIKRVTWLLKTTKAFKHLFPTEMIEEVAKVVAYDRYDDNRHIAYQGRPPEMFYYVLAGRIHKLREYKLTSGCVNKPMGFMHKGSTSDPEEMEHQWNRECHLVSKGPVEVLVLSREDFTRLQHTTQGPPIDFLYSIDLFKEFPCEMFIDNEDAIIYKYYGQNRVITPNVNRTAWLHVVKSGHVKVVRRQTVVDVRGDTKFQSKNSEDLGCGRSFSHAKAMLGNLISQRKMKNLTDISLPDLMKRRSTTLLEAGMRGGRSKKKPVLKLTTPIIREIPAPKTEVTGEMGDVNGETLKNPQKDFSLPPIIVGNGEPGTSSTVQNGATSPRSNGVTSPRAVNRLALSLPNGVIVDPSKTGGIQPHGTFLTREKTAAEIEAMFLQKPKKEVPLRKTCVQLDLLKPGDVFHTGITAKDLGLETLELPTIQKIEGPPLCLVSDGAEVIKISKRFFLQHAQNNTMLRVETMQRSYLSTDEAKDILFDKETWGQYKEALMKRLIAGLPR